MEYVQLNLIETLFGGEKLDVEKVEVDKYITRTIATIGPLRFKMYVPLLQNNRGEKPIITNWAREVTVSLTEHLYFVEGFACVSIDIVSPQGKDSSLSWKKMGLTMTQKTQHMYVEAFNKILRIISGNEVFYVDSDTGRLKLYQIDRNQIVQVTTAGDDNIFELRPAIITEDEDEYVGAVIAINSTSNTAAMSIDEIRAIARLLDRIDIFTYSQGLINMYMLYKEKPIGENILVKKPTKLFEKKQVSHNPQSEAEKPLGGEEVVSSNSPLPNANDESLFDGLN